MNPLHACALCGIGLLLQAQAATAQEDALPEPVAVFLERCYEPIRLTGQPKLPVPDNDPGWIAADERLREALGVDNAEAEAWLRPDPEGNGFLALQFLERVLTDAGVPLKDETHQRCRLTYSGPESEKTVYDGLVAFLGLEGTRKGVSEAGYDTPKGWRQWCWSDNPGKHDRNWEMYERPNDPGRSGCLIANIDRYFTAMDLIHVRLLAKKEPPKLIAIVIDRVFRPEDGGG